jgi:hypothetical protein
MSGNKINIRGLDYIVLNGKHKSTIFTFVSHVYTWHKIGTYIITNTTTYTLDFLYVHNHKATTYIRLYMYENWVRGLGNMGGDLCPQMRTNKFDI